MPSEPPPTPVSLRPEQRAESPRKAGQPTQYEVSGRKPRILVTGGSGFIGRRLCQRLAVANEYDLLCMSRDSRPLQGVQGVRMVQADAQDYASLSSALSGVDLAFYLMHSMEGGGSHWERFAERDRKMAENFAKASSECGVKRIVYLGGLAHGEEEALSQHMRSRREVGEILKTSKARVTIFRAAVVLGEGSASFRMVSELVDRLPLMVCPRWVTTRVQPISVDDVVSYLSESIANESTAGREFDIGGPDILTYMDLMKLYASIRGKRFRAQNIPFLSLRLSSYWIDLVTDVPASLARPLVESLTKEAVVSEDSVKEVMPLRLKTCREAIESAVNERRPAKEASGRGVALVVLLSALGVLGVLNPKLPTLLGGQNIILAVPLCVWLAGVGVSIFFSARGTRLGSLGAGVVGWLFVAFWTLDLAGLAIGQKPGLASPAALLEVFMVFVGAVTTVVGHLSFHRPRRRSSPRPRGQREPQQNAESRSVGRRAG